MRSTFVLTLETVASSVLVIDEQEASLKMS